MTSHEYANRLRAVADKLEMSPEFELPDYEHSYIEKHGIIKIHYYNDKSGFIAAAKAIRSGTKGGDNDTFTFRNGDLVIAAERNTVCRIVKPAVPAEYECEPLLSPQEEAQVG